MWGHWGGVDKGGASGGVSNINTVLIFFTLHGIKRVPQCSYIRSTAYIREKSIVMLYTSIRSPCRDTKTNTKRFEIFPPDWGMSRRSRQARSGLNTNISLARDVHYIWTKSSGLQYR